MQNLRLVKPTLDHKDAYLAMLDEWKAYGGRISPYAMQSHGLEYEAWLEDLKRREQKEQCPLGFMPQYLYFLVDDGGIIGAIAIRPELNEDLLLFGGHIGYGIRPSKRGWGYGKVQLKLGLELCRDQFGLDQALITCNKNNLPSAGVIQANGGQYENDVVDEDGITVSRYMINL